ncbi:MAG: flagellar motor protein MotB [Bacteroidetes bacterium]|nr:MAG: flagellar motor protein MotB [Bacteroidota bacterium]
MLLGACASVKPCGEAYTEEQQFFQSKKFKEAVAQRDSLCERTADLEGILKATEQNLAKTKDDLESSKKQAADLAGQLADSKKSYEQLKLSSGAQVAGLSSDLAAKQAELAQKEELLKNREERLQMLEEIIKKQDELMNALSDRVKNALMGFDADELSVEMKDGKVYVSMSDKLLFKSGSDAVEPKGVDALKKIAEVMMKNIDINMAIEGHTDSIPIKTNRFKDNWDLSTARATSVVRILTDNGVDPKRLIASGKGEFTPKADNGTKEGRAANRRTEVVLSPKLNEIMQLLGQYSR